MRERCQKGDDTNRTTLQLFGEMQIKLVRMKKGKESQEQQQGYAENGPVSEIIRE